MMQRRLPAEWEEQDGVLLAWPHPASDWSTVLKQVEPVFAAIAATISRFERVLIVAPSRADILHQIADAGGRLERVSICTLATNDTWSRDFGPLAVEIDGQPLLLDFGFNGWGLKFAANHDNQITRSLHVGGLFAPPLETIGLVLEGGSIESDGHGTILTTSECLLNPNRNPHLGQTEIENELGRIFGATHWLWLHYGYLAGDDTDSHIDTLARLCPDDTIVYVRCDDPQDEHYEALTRMEAELGEFLTRQGQPFRLLPLPWPKPCFDDAGERLPATYANYLVINGAVLVPTYGDPDRDATALSVLARAFPGREIIGIDCRPLILQHGSLHCVTMQLPRGVLVE